jgi:hypothetical protein
MKVFVIHSSQYYRQVINYKDLLESQGHEVYLPVLDTDQTKTELEICTANKNGILWADECHLFWDGHSRGSTFDMGMAFMANKPIKLIHLNPKSLVNFIKQYEEQGNV